jgi:phosphatidylserine decarboxylase
VLTQTALGLAAALAVSLPIARKWELRMTGVLLTIVIAGLFSGIVVDTVALPLGVRAVIVAALSVTLALMLLAYRFFRDPERVPPQIEGAVVSPADGEVVYVREASAGVLPVVTKVGRSYRLIELTRTRLNFEDAVVIGIGMSFSDVHVNRAPITGVVTARSHFPGRFGSLGRAGMEFENERTTTVLDGDGLQVAIVQIASRLVRQIASFVGPGENVLMGDRIGAIRFGSQVDVVLPREVDVRVSEGDRVRAGESVIARCAAPVPNASVDDVPGHLVVQGDGATSPR